MGADLFISCHANSFNDAGKKETLVHYNEKGNSKDLAAALCSTISNALGTTSLGVSTNSYLIEMNSTSMPAVLMEPIFISNQSDCDKYKKYTGKALGIALAQTVAKFI